MGTAKASQKSRDTCGTCRAQSSPQVGPPEGDSGNAAQQEDFVALPDNFCIIESANPLKISRICRWRNWKRIFNLAGTKYSFSWKKSVG
eukprot:jgi/Picre1/30031/NNA_005403.t1